MNHTISPAISRIRGMAEGCHNRAWCRIGHPAHAHPPRSAYLAGMLAIILAAALNADVKPVRSEVTTALFKLVNGESFMDPKKNDALQAILARNPKLDVYETAALGTS